MGRFACVCSILAACGGAQPTGIEASESAAHEPACSAISSVDTSDPTGAGCTASPEFVICGPSCTNACSRTEYALTCHGAGPASIPVPAPYLHCKGIGIPTPSTELFYCCPCG